MPSTPELFKKYKSNILIETGTFLGQGIKNAIIAGYDEIISIELSEDLYLKARELFKNNNTVKLVHGNSGDKLISVLSKINEQCTFWLDGHYSGGITAGKGIPGPLNKELETIKNHHIKNHIILIDDIRGEDVSKLLDKLKSINKDYNFYFEDSFMNGQVLFEKDILVAKI